MFKKMLEKMANDDYRLAYNLVSSAVSCCPVVLVMMNDKMIRRAGIAEEMKIRGVQVIRDKSDCELTLTAVGKSGKNIMMIYDRSWNAFRCAINKRPNLDGAHFFKVEPKDVPDFLYEATMA